MDPSALSQIKHLQTVAEVHQLFGKPKETVRGALGQQLDIFAAFVDSNSRRPVADVEVRTLHVLYYEGRVIKYTSHTGKITRFADLQLGRPITSDLLNGLERDMMNREDLIASLGPPTVEGLNVYGDPTMHWFFLEGRKFNSRNLRELRAILDDEGILRDFAFRVGD